MDKMLKSFEKRIKRFLQLPLFMMVFGSLIFLLMAFCFTDDFINKQKNKPKVKSAYKEKETFLKQLLEKQSLTFEKINILLCAYKKEKELVLYVKSPEAKTYVKLKTYLICEQSGVLGPKRKQGDGQVPEGFYYINHFNPESAYHLSLGITYPNASDRIKTTAKDPGGAIYIHGECVTIGCMPMTNDKIKEIYVLALQAYQSGQKKIPVYSFPCQLTKENMEDLKSTYKTQADLLAFWLNLKEGYDKFNSSKSELNVMVSKNGDYIFAD